MMLDEKIQRINELAKKQKSIGLSDEEKQEQQILRQDYIKLFRQNLEQTLGTIKVQDEQGNIRSLKKK